MDATLKRQLVDAQRMELAEHLVYAGLARRATNPGNREVLERISGDERRHYDFWAEHTGEHPPAKALVVWKYLWLARLLGLTFTIKFMEQGEAGAQIKYGEVAKVIPAAAAVAHDEQDHENALMEMIDEERLHYVGAIVLGLNDALVELTGALAGFTLALQNCRLIAIIGLITGVAAALSMAASVYLSTKADVADERSPLKAAFYTGIAYVITVAILIAPFLLLANPLLALAAAVSAALLIILLFSYYMAVAKGLPLWRRFAEMAVISLGVALISFAIGYLIRLTFPVAP